MRPSRELEEAVAHGTHSVGHAADMNWSTRGVDAARIGSGKDAK